MSMATAPEAIFEPALYSLPELHFFLDHLGEPPVAAMHKGLPQGVNSAAVRECLGRLYELAELERHRDVKWAGLETVRDSIVRYLAWQERTREIQRRGGPRHASQHVWDGKNRYKGASGSDSGDRVRSEILSDGSYASFTVNLLQPFGDVAPTIAEVAPWLKQTEFGTTRELDRLTTDEEHGNLQCSICKQTIRFKVGSRASQNMARAQMARHLKSADVHKERHLLLLRKEFH